MNSSSVLDRIDAWRRGRAIPIGQSLPWRRAAQADRLILAFVRMGGEAVPWGVAIGPPGTTPALHLVIEPRSVEAHLQVMLQVAPALLEHLPHPQYLDKEQHSTIGTVARQRQLWLPGPSHIDMLHLLDFRYTLGRNGNAAELRLSRAFGRACGWLFRESTRPGQLRVFDATQRLKQTFAFPAEDARQAHLGYLLAWLTEAGTREEKADSAAQAEQQAVSVSLDPELERSFLVGALDQYNADPNSDEGQSAAETIRKLLNQELLRRWKLTEQAMFLLDNDSRASNTQLEALEKLGASEFESQYWRTENRVYDPDSSADDLREAGTHPETDFRPTKAASRYFEHLHAHELLHAELIHGDPDLIEAAIDAGDALCGEIIQVADEGKGRASRPVWTVVSGVDDALRLREESSVCVIGHPSRHGRIRSIEVHNGQRVVVVEITAGTSAKKPEGILAASDKVLEGRRVTLLDLVLVGLSSTKARAVWNDTGPGAWLTHSAPLPESTVPASDATDLLSLVETLRGSR